MAINGDAAPVRRTDFAAYLREQGIVRDDALERAMLAAQQSSMPLPSVLVNLGLLPDAQCCQALADFTGIPCLDGTALAEADISAGSLPQRFLRERHILPLRETADELCVAVADPTHELALKALKLSAGKRIVLATAPKAAIDRALDAWFSQEKLPATPNQIVADQDLDRLRDLASEAPVIRRAARLIDEAVARRASDIHIESSSGGLRIRYRVDGRLVRAGDIDAALAPAVLSRLKLLAHMDIAESRLPQDGRIRTTASGRAIDLRVATLPSMRGETMVIRVLDRDTVALDLPQLGFAEPLISQLRAVLRQPHGIVLVTGPTGSGKTTTLYAGLAELNHEDVKVITIEDPVEYEMVGLVQVQVKPAIGLDFADVLRAALRHNPNILLVGEIRDTTTARLAIEAALTGHLVMATLHTNSAPASIARLIDMGVEDYLLASTLAGVLAQRLVRRLCPDCRRAEEMEPALRARLEREGVPVPDGARQYRPQGCAACAGKGYRGRTTIAELMRVDEAVRAAVYARADAPALKRAAMGQGFATMRANGIMKALAGETSLEEVFNATQEG